MTLERGCAQSRQAVHPRGERARIGGLYTEPVDLAWRVSELVAQARNRVGVERTPHIEICAMAVRHFHLTVDEFWNANLHSAWAGSFGSRPTAALRNDHSAALKKVGA